MKWMFQVTNNIMQTKCKRPHFICVHRAFTTDVTKSKQENFDLKWMNQGALETYVTYGEEQVSLKSNWEGKCHDYPSPLTTKLLSMTIGCSPILCKELQWLVNRWKIGGYAWDRSPRQDLPQQVFWNQEQRPLWREHWKAHNIQFSSLPSSASSSSNSCQPKLEHFHEKEELQGPTLSGCKELKTYLSLNTWASIQIT